MRRARWTLIAAVILLAGTATASADPIIITRDSRETLALGLFNHDTEFRRDGARSGDNLVSTVTPPTGIVGGATATLTSSFADPLHWRGVGTANAFWTAPAGSAFDAGSAFVTEFEVTSPLNYTFNGDLAAAFSACCRTFGGEATGLLQFNTGREDREGDPILEALFFVRTPPEFQSSGTANISSSGRLQPGQYRLFMEALALGGSADQEAAGFAGSNFAFTFDFTPADSSPSPTPEPASLLLLGTGIAGVFGYRCRSVN